MKELSDLARASTIDTTVNQANSLSLLACTETEVEKSALLLFRCTGSARIGLNTDIYVH